MKNKKTKKNRQKTQVSEFSFFKFEDFSLNSNKVHFRRCHVCDHVNHCEGELVTECHQCHKKLLPFLYFDEREVMGFNQIKLNSIITTKLPHKNYPPLIGITSYWDGEWIEFILLMQTKVRLKIISHLSIVKYL